MTQSKWLEVGADDPDVQAHLAKQHASRQEINLDQPYHPSNSKEVGQIAESQIRQHYPNAPDWYIKMMMPLAQRISSNPQAQSNLQAISPITQGITGAVEGLNIPQFAGGILQGTGDIGASLGNIAARPLGVAIGKDMTIPHPNLQKYIPNDLASRIAFGGGELASQLPLFMSGAGAIGRATGLGEKAGLGGEAAQGALSGVLMGENKEGEGRLGSAFLGAALPVAGKIVKSIPSLRSKNIAKDVLKGMQETKSEYGKQFNKVLSEAEKEGVKIKTPDINIGVLKKASSSNKQENLLDAVENFYNSPTMKNAHEAQTDLGRLMETLNPKASNFERHAFNEAKRLKDNINENIMKGLWEKGRTDLVEDYITAKHGYKNEFIPYTKSQSIKNLLEGKLRPKKFAKSIAQEENFMAKLGKKHPEISLREKLSSVANSPIGRTAIGGAAAIGLGGLGLHGLKRLIK